MLVNTRAYIIGTIIIRRSCLCTRAGNLFICSKNDHLKPHKHTHKHTLPSMSHISCSCHNMKQLLVLSLPLSLSPLKTETVFIFVSSFLYDNISLCKIHHSVPNTQIQTFHTISVRLYYLYRLITPKEFVSGWFHHDHHHDHDHH